MAFPESKKLGTAVDIYGFKYLSAGFLPFAYLELGLLGTSEYDEQLGHNSWMGESSSLELQRDTQDSRRTPSVIAENTFLMS